MKFISRDNENLCRKLLGYLGPVTSVPIPASGKGA